MSLYSPHGKRWRIPCLKPTAWLQREHNSYASLFSPLMNALAQCFLCTWTSGLLGPPGGGGRFCGQNVRALLYSVAPSWRSTTLCSCPPIKQSFSKEVNPEFPKFAWTQNSYSCLIGIPAELVFNRTLRETLFYPKYWFTLFSIHMSWQRPMMKHQTVASLPGRQSSDVESEDPKCFVFQCCLFDHILFWKKLIIPRNYLKSTEFPFMLHMA